MAEVSQSECKMWIFGDSCGLKKQALILQHYSLSEELVHMFLAINKA